MAVNWKKGFRRVAFVWAALAAIAGGTVALKLVDNANAKALQDTRRTLEILKASPAGNGSGRLEDWKECTSFEEQKLLWKVWTGEDLEKLPKRTSLKKNTSGRLEDWKKNTGSYKSVQQLKRLWELQFPTDENLEKLPKRKSLKKNTVREEKPTFEELVDVNFPIPEVASEHRINFRRESWETFYGTRLPYTPVEVDAMFDNRIEKDVRSRLRGMQCEYPIGTVLGAMVGFGAVWLVYLFFERLVSWVIRGFNGAITEQKSGEKKIEN